MVVMVVVVACCCFYNLWNCHSIQSWLSSVAFGGPGLKDTDCAGGQFEYCDWFLDMWNESACGRSLSQLLEFWVHVFMSRFFDSWKSGWLARIWFIFFLLNIFSVLWILETSSVLLNSWVWKVHVSSSRRTTTMPLCASLSLWKHLRVDWVLSAAIFRTWRVLFIFSWCPSTVLTLLSYVSKSLLFCLENN